MRVALLRENSAATPSHRRVGKTPLCTPGFSGVSVGEGGTTRGAMLTSPSRVDVQKGSSRVGGGGGGGGVGFGGAARTFFSSSLTRRDRL